MATAFFDDAYCGKVPMRIEQFNTTRRGVRTICFRWVKAPGVAGCVTTGFGSFALYSQAYQAAKRHARFSDVSSTWPAGAL